MQEVNRKISKWNVKKVEKKKYGHMCKTGYVQRIVTLQ